MDLDHVKERIREIIRKSSGHNYFSPFLPKYSKNSKSTNRKKSKNSDLASQNLTFNLLVPIKNVPQLPSLENQPNQGKRFIQLSSKQLNFPEMFSKAAKVSQIQRINEIMLKFMRKDVKTEASRPVHHSLERVLEFKERKKKQENRNSDVEKGEYGLVNVKKVRSVDMKEKNFRKIFKRKSGVEKIVSAGGESEDCVINAWEHEKFPDLSFYNND